MTDDVVLTETNAVLGKQQASSTTNNSDSSVKRPLPKKVRSLKSEIMFYGGIILATIIFLIIFIPMIFGKLIKTESTNVNTHDEYQNQPVEQQSLANSASGNDERFEMLTAIVVDQKQKINELTTQNQQIKQAITQNKKDIEAMKLQLLTTGKIVTPTVYSNIVDSGNGNHLNLINNVLLTAYKINNIDKNLAWISHKGKIYALQRNDKLNGITFIDFDLKNRLVITDKGIIK